MAGSRIDAGNVIVSAALMVLIVGAFVLLFQRSYERNRSLHGRARIHSALIAVLAVWAWPVTLLYWWKGPTPERRTPSVKP
jgi:hypothetical protein